MCMADKQFDTALKNALTKWNKQVEIETDEEIPSMSAAFIERMDNIVRKSDIETNIPAKKNIRNRNKVLVAVVCAAVVLATTGCIYVAVPEVRDFINMLFLREDSMTQLTEVPDGWIGVYSAEDIEKIREDLHANYILMNDIEIPESYYESGGIYENGFTPIGGGKVTDLDFNENSEEQFSGQDTAFLGTFNGNGYVISNLHIREDFDSRNIYAGLFGKCNMNAGAPLQDPETQEFYRHYTGGIIKNLGIEDSSVEILIDSPQLFGNSAVNIGMIAGECDVVAGCYTENVLVSVTFADSIDPELVFSNVKIGGVAGKTIITDSCWSNADIKLENISEAKIKNPYVAGVTGFANSCITSYFNGNIQSVEADYGVVGIDSTNPPTLISDTIMLEIKERLLAAEDESGFTKLASYYAYCRADEMQMYITKDISTTSRYFYLVDPYIKDRERQELSRIIATVFTSDEFIQFCQINNVKYGAFDNYDLRYETDCSFDGFDFNYIWSWDEDGLPKHRLF